MRTGPSAAPANQPDPGACRMNGAGEERNLTTEIAPEPVPTQLKQKAQWLCWRGEWSKGKKKLNKVPKTSKRKAASSTDEGTWTTFENAVDAVDTRGLDGIGFAGLG